MCFSLEDFKRVFRSAHRELEVVSPLSLPTADPYGTCAASPGQVVRRPMMCLDA